MNKFVTLLVVLLVSAAAYAFGSKQATKTDSATLSSAAPAPADSVWVSRSDGAQSCEPKSGQSLDDGADALNKNHIEVFSQRKGNDGKMHIQMCGAPKGSTNAYLIKRGDLAKAMTLGFMEQRK